MRAINRDAVYPCPKAEAERIIALDMDYTAPMVYRMKYTKANTSENYKGNACNLRLKALEDNRFDLVSNEEIFKKIISDLEKHAEII